MTIDDHQCPYPGCDRRIAYEQLACKPHWFTVSKPIRDRVWRAYRGSSGDHTNAIVAAMREMREHYERSSA